MTKYRLHKIATPAQYFFSIAITIIVSFLCFAFAKYIGYKIVALILLMVVSILAMLLDILPVLFAAVLSALIWNFFFIPPIFTFHINDTEDLLMFLMYFIIALVNAVLTFKIREVEKSARDKEEKEHTIKLYNTLLNSLSHELRTPIATIIGAVDTLKENHEKLSETNQATLLNEIDTASNRLNGQVENLLNMSRLESGILKIKPDWCDINELIYSIINKLESADRTIIFTASENLPLFKIDIGLIEQVLYNLLHNAVQYTPYKTIIKVEAHFVNEQLEMIIEDNGKGFPDSEIQFVFDKFFRLPLSKPGGIGLGLSIVKGFITAHKGEIKLENNINSGAKFTITIPAEVSFLNNLKND